MAMMMEVEEKEKEEETDGGERGKELERMVMAAVKASEERGDPPLLRAMEASRCVREEERLDLASILVSNLCFSSNTLSLWKLLEQAVAARIVSPVLTLALLTARVIPCRREEPEAYTLYLELLNRYLFSHRSMESATHRDKITEIIDNALQLSHTYGIQNIDFGHIMVFLVLHVIMSLVDGTLEDWGLQFVSTDKQHNVYANEGDQAMNIDPKENSNHRRHVHREELHRANSLMALEVVEKITANKSAKVFLRLIHLNMPEKFNGLLQRLLFMEAHKSTSQSIVSANYILVKLSANIQKVPSADCQLNRNHFLGILLNAKTCIPTSRYNSGAGRSACWISFHTFMENAMDGKNLHALSAVDILTELTKTLQVINRASWQETFQALWISALCLVQRDNERWEGPMPRLVARLCMLLSIVPLAIVPIVKEECKISDPRSSNEHGMDGNKLSSRRKGLISSLQILGQFSELISPPPSVVNAANDAASKAATFISIVKSGNPSPNIVSHNDVSVQAVGNMLHLIVEACIARKLIDTSAYFWPGYVVSSAPSKDSVPLKDSPWSTFMDGSQLISSLRNGLMVTPASSITELDKLYNIALNGPEEEKASAAMILCGATLTHGWNIQEHVVHTVIKLLSPPVPPDFSGPCHLIAYMPMLSALLFGLVHIDTVHILALYGKVPEVAVALLPLCEAFGSVAPPSNNISSPSDMTSIYSVFSCAFLFLLRLWKFYKPPQEHTIAGRCGPVKLELTLDYLFLMRNRRIALRNSAAKNTCRNSTDSLSSHRQPVYIDSFPKMRGWYLQNQACIASTLSGLCSKNPVHQVANKLLNMMCRKMTKAGNVSGNPSPISSASITGSPGSSAQDVHVWPILPAWEVLEAIPFVLEAVLTACAHGRLSSRDLTTGLRDLVDFLPASLATIVSYFSAEITRGIWKPVSMNGTDWPSPSAHLLSVESEIMDVLSSAGVHVPRCYESGMDPILPLPMAALVSLTITFKLDKSLSYIHNVVGQALENCASGCSWPSMPIIGALWTQKVSRWHDFIIFACTLSPFTRDNNAVAQLIRSCFSSFLGQDSPHLTSHGGINGLLGHTISNGGIPLPISPGFLYLRTCRTFRDTHFVSSVILSLVVEWANVSAARCSSRAPPICLKSGQSSLASAAAGVREAATLGASLLCIAGGVQLVQVLYEETLPMSLLSERQRPGKVQGTEDVGPMPVLEGYAMAYFVILCGVYVWGVRDRSPTYYLMFVSKRARALGVHMECMVEVIEGKNIAVKCDTATLKAYVTCLVGLLVELVPAWVPGIKKEILLRIVNGLREWHEDDLALELLKCGGVELMTAVVESVIS